MLSTGTHKTSVYLQKNHLASSMVQVWACYSQENAKGWLAWLICVLRYSAAAEAHVLWGLGIRHPSEVAKVEERLNTAGFPTIDISSIEAAQVCSSSHYLLQIPPVCQDVFVLHDAAFWMCVCCKPDLVVNSAPRSISL